MLFCIELYNAAMYYHSRPIPTYLSRPIPLELVLGLITVKSRMEVLAWICALPVFILPMLLLTLCSFLLKRHC